MKNDLIKNKNNPVFVLDKNGIPLMPTNRFKKVRELRKKGLAKVVSYDPFTIKMLYDVGKETQKLTLGIDSGTSHIGASVVLNNGNELFSATFNTNTLGIKDKMEKRAIYRHTRKRHKRDKKKRRARANGTIFSGEKLFFASGASTPTKYKEIKSKICKLNKNIDDGKLSNTVIHCYNNHINVVNMIAKRLPIKEITIEYAHFDTHKLVNPNVTGKNYQQGALYNELNHKAYVLSRDNHTCVLCNKKKKNDILEVHHVVYRSNGGADHFNNLVTLHKECHKKVHNNDIIEKKLFSIIKQKDILKDSIQTRPSTILNSAMSRVVNQLKKEYCVNISFGFETKAKRYEYNIKKTHNNDAYLVALGDKKPTKKRINHFEYDQFSKNERKYIYKTKQRKYSEITSIISKKGELKTKLVGVCFNRKKAMEQKEFSLEEYRQEFGQKAVSKLKVTKGTRTFIDRSGYSFNKGDLVLNNNRIQVISGVTNGGLYVRIVGEKTKNFKPSELVILERAKNFRRVNW